MQGPERRITAEQIAIIEAQLFGTREMMRLLNSGPGGIAQLRRITKQKIDELESVLALARTSAKWENSDGTKPS